MKLRNRIGVAIATVSLGVIGLAGMSACSPSAASAAALSPDQSALTALGFSTDDVTANGTVTPAADPSAGPTAKQGKHPRLRKLAIRRIAMRKNVEHGLVTVETKSGDKTIDVQRGTITAITSTTMTVKSKDGYSETWTFGSPINVIDHRQTVQPKSLAAGAEVGVSGTQSGSTNTASLIVVPTDKDNTGS
jgi:hypothetical protein